jgi:hypothetical protein
MFAFNNLAIQNLVVLKKNVIWRYHLPPLQVNNSKVSREQKTLDKQW